jgi:hypothetical protein
MEKLPTTYIKQLLEATSAHLALLSYNYLNKAMKTKPKDDNHNRKRYVIISENVPLLYVIITITCDSTKLREVSHKSICKAVEFQHISIVHKSACISLFYLLSEYWHFHL